MTKPIQVGDLVRPKLIAAGKHLWLVIGEEVQRTSISGPWATIRYLTIAYGSNKMQLYEKDLEKVSE